MDTARSKSTTTSKEAIPRQLPTGQPTNIPRKLAVLPPPTRGSTSHGSLIKNTLTISAGPAKGVTVRAVAGYVAGLRVPTPSSTQVRSRSSLVAGQTRRSWADTRDKLHTRKAPNVCVHPSVDLMIGTRTVPPLFGTRSSFIAID